MSGSRKGRKIKLTNPEEQPQIKDYILENSASASSASPALNKKRRRSTGEKPTSNKRKNSVVEITATTILSVDEDNNPTAEMSSEQSSGSTMLDEIRKMEERLSEKITSNKEAELTNMEQRLNATITNSISDALKSMQASIGTVVQNNPIIHSHTMELKGLKEENMRLNRKVQQLNAEQSRMKRQLTKIENRNLERSLIIRGLPEEYKETDLQLKEKLHLVISVIMQGDSDETRVSNAKQITILNCRRLGRFARSRTRPVSMELQHKQDVEFILDNRFDLERGIYVDREYPPDIERKRKTLLPILKAAKKLSDYKTHSRLEEDKIVLKGKPYTVNMLNQLPEELNAFKVTSKEDDNTIGFFGEINPLSNFFPSPFIYEGIQYTSSEQWIQSTKAKFFGDMENYNKILGCTTSWECKELSRQINFVNETKWDEVAANLCHPGIRAKFHQNTYAMETLIHRTHGKHIVECAKDRLWGNGRSISDPLCLVSTNWISPGIMGPILESIRDEELQNRNIAYSHLSNPITHAVQSNPFIPTSLECEAITPNVTVSAPIHIPIRADISSNASSSTPESGSTSTTPVSDTTASDTDRDHGPQDNSEVPMTSEGVEMSNRTSKTVS